MTEKDLRKKIGIQENQLLNTSNGLADILFVKDNEVTIGFLASSKQVVLPVEELLEKYKF